MRNSHSKKQLNKLLLETRLKLGLSQSEIAKKLGYTSAQYISNWERGTCSPPLDKLHKLTKILKIDPKLLMDIILADTENFLREELLLPDKTRRIS